MSNKEIQNLLILEIVAPSEITETTLPQEERDMIFAAYKMHKSPKEIFSCIENEDIRNKYIKLFKALNN